MSAHVQWGVEHPDAGVLICDSEAAADEQVSRYGADVVRVVLREVTDWFPRGRERSQTSTPVDALPDASLLATDAHSITPDLAASGPDHAADVAGTT